MSWVLVALGAWALGWWVNSRLAASPLARTQAGKLAVPVIFGLTILILWEGLVRGLNVSPVILPPPSAVAVRFGESLPILWGDFVQTAVKGALSGYLIGCAAAFATAIVIDRKVYMSKYRKALEQGKTAIAPEHRLYAGMLGAAGVPIG